MERSLNSAPIDAPIAVMHRFACWVLAALAVGCARIEFSVNGGSGGGEPAAGGGAQPIGGENNAGGGGETTSGGGGGGGPCPGVPETCNGIDDDCNGIADDPPGGMGSLCAGCNWLTYDAKLYVSCPNGGVDPANANCPTGMEIVVLQSQAELDALNPIVSVSSFVAFRQADSSPDRTAGWAWTQRTGMPPPWADGQPDDYGSLEPVRFETGPEDCAGLYRIGDIVDFSDAPCVGGFHEVLCEQVSDECIPDAPCLLAEGCQGVSDCTRAPGDQCVAAGVAEKCNGLDDNCNGTVDENVCGCTNFTDAFTGRVYRRCDFAVVAENTHCGPGFRPAYLTEASEVSFADSLIGAGDSLWMGLYQETPAATLTEGWVHFDGQPLTAPFWAGSQPNDGTDDVETGEQNCASLVSGGAHDTDCAALQGYLCEEL